MLVAIRVHLFQECCEKRCAMSHEPVLHKKLLVNEIDVTKEEARNGTMVGMNKYA